jgi:EAL domain-containing protein (putative c-di-GMP-specific phosphodiesterase class I)
VPNVTGYSSLSYLRSLPFDRLKIDREFVRGVAGNDNSRAICKALIELTQGLRIGVLAEGTEDLEEVFELQRLGCHTFQGFVFAPPLPSAEFLERAEALTWLDDRLATSAA